MVINKYLGCLQSSAHPAFIERLLCPWRQHGWEEDGWHRAQWGSHGRWCRGSWGRSLPPPGGGQGLGLSPAAPPGIRCSCWERSLNKHHVKGRELLWLSPAIAAHTHSKPQISSHCALPEWLTNSLIHPSPVWFPPFILRVPGKQSCPGNSRDKKIKSLGFKKQKIEGTHAPNHFFLF